VDASIQVITATAAVIALVHTVLGVDHYLPFVALARARGWTYPKMATIVVVCGIGHVASSILLGLVGLALGRAVEGLQAIETARGDIASLLMIAFGLAYMVWGLRAAKRNKRHSHHHAHADGEEHAHDHDHHGDHGHVHAPPRKPGVFWPLFLVFVLGPCEPLIPLLMYPAAKASMLGAVWVAGVFGVVTIVTMLVMTTLLHAGARRVRLRWLEGYEHAAAGFAILAAGLLIVAAGV